MTADRYELARQAEIAAWSYLFGRAPRAMRATLGLAIEHARGDVVISAPAVDHPMLNRALMKSRDPEAIDSVVRQFRERGVDRFFVQRRRREDAAPPAGLVRYSRSWIKLVGRVVSPDRLPLLYGVRVAPARTADALECGALFCQGFDLPAQVGPLLAAAVGRPSWRVFVARDRGGALAGVGYLFAGEVAHLTGAVTAPAFRGRGVQRALLAARFAAAADAGCRWVTSETGDDAPGDPQHSKHNMQRFSMEVVGATENLVPAGVRWSQRPRPAAGERAC